MFMETGLQGLDFLSRPPLSPDEGILPPTYGFKPQTLISSLSAFLGAQSG